jgi:hypothetical protein
MFHHLPEKISTIAIAIAGIKARAAHRLPFCSVVCYNDL